MISRAPRDRLGPLALAMALGLLALVGAGLLGAEEPRKPTVAILYFDYTGTTEALGVLRKGLAQMLISHVKPRASGVRVLERDRIQDLFAELDLSATDKVNPEMAVQMGKILGAHYVVVGNYFDLYGGLRVDCRLVEVETSEILASLGADGLMTDFMSIEQGLVADLSASIRALSVGPPRRPPMGDRAKAFAEREPMAEPAESLAKPQPRAELKAPVRGRSNAGSGLTLAISTAVVQRYSAALDAKDHGDVDTARAVATDLRAAHPKFELLDLESLIQ